MNRTIEGVAAYLGPIKRRAITPNAKQVTANWQNGLESGLYVQRKLRLTFTSPLAQRTTN